jgi:hypothetical protein
MMLPPGSIVRRRKRRKTMVVLETAGQVVWCGWVDNGRFYKRRFPVDQLIVCQSWSDFWPLT